MTTTTEPVRREPSRRDDTIRMQRWLRTPAVPIAKAWWQRQTHQTRTGLVVALVFVLAGMLSLGASLSRPAGQPADAPANATTLKQEAAAPDAGRIWVATKTWQGSGSKETEQFTVSGHWRIDWIFSPASSTGGVFQVFIYAADGRQLLTLAANNEKGGSNTSFWAGPGTYFLKVNSSSGDWKVGIQDLR